MVVRTAMVRSARTLAASEIRTRGKSRTECGGGQDRRGMQARPSPSQPRSYHQHPLHVPGSVRCTGLLQEVAQVAADKEPKGRSKLSRFAGGRAGGGTGRDGDRNPTGPAPHRGESPVLNPANETSKGVNTVFFNEVVGESSF